MSVDRNDYIVYGWKLPYKLKNENGEIDFWDDKFLPYIEGHKGVDYTLIIDGMCGEYTVFGKKIAKDSGNYEGWDFVNLQYKALDPEEAKAKYRELFDLKPEEPIADPYLFIFSHFS